MKSKIYRTKSGSWVVEEDTGRRYFYTWSDALRFALSPYRG